MFEQDGIYIRPSDMKVFRCRHFRQRTDKGAMVEILKEEGDKIIVLLLELEDFKKHDITDTN